MKTYLVGVYNQDEFVLVIAEKFRIDYEDGTLEFTEEGSDAPIAHFKQGSWWCVYRK